VINPFDASRSHFIGSRPHINQYSQVENTEFISSLPAFSSKIKEDCAMRRAGDFHGAFFPRILRRKRLHYI